MMGQSTYEFRWIFLVFRRWLWLIIAFTVMAGIAAYFVIAQKPPVYKASVTLLIEPSRDAQSGDYSALIAAERLALTYSEMIKGEAILNALINDLDLETTTGQLADKITVQPIQDTQLIRLTVEDESPDQSAEIANTLAESFVAHISKTQSERYAADIAEIQTKLQDLDNRIKTDQSQIDELQIQTITYTNKLEQLQSSLVETHNDSRLLEQEHQDVQLAMAQVMDNVKIVQSAQAPTNRPSLSYKAIVLLLVKQEIATGINDSAPILASERLTQTYAQLLQSRNVLQEVIAQLELTQSIETIQKKISIEPVKNTQLIQLAVVDYNPQLAVELANSLADVFVRQMQLSLGEPYSSRIKDTEARLAGMAAEEDSLKAQIEEVSSTKVELESEIKRLESVVAEDRNGYQTNKEEYERLRQLATDASEAVYITEPANIPSKPDTNTRLYFGLSVILGGMIGFSFAFLLEYMDDTIRTVNDVAKELGLNILGMIGYLNNDDSPLVVVADPLSPISEAFRVLANNIRFAIPDRSAKTLIITSPSSKEGKSLVLANLAVTMARLEQTVVAVDADLRLPTLHKLFGLEQGGGLTDALLDGSIDGWLNEVNVEGLKVLPCGKLPASPTEVIGSARMRNLLNELQHQTNLVLIDCPPVLPVADAPVLASTADGVILVLRINQTRRRATRDALRRLQQAGAKVIGVVLNALPASSEGYYTYPYQKREKGKFNLGKLLPRKQIGGFFKSQRSKHHREGRTNGRSVSE